MIKQWEDQMACMEPKNVITLSALDTGRSYSYCDALICHLSVTSDSVHLLHVSIIYFYSSWWSLLEE